MKRVFLNQDRITANLVFGAIGLKDKSLIRQLGLYKVYVFWDGPFHVTTIL